jgi:hypothetical protein
LDVRWLLTHFGVPKARGERPQTLQSPKNANPPDAPAQIVEAVRDSIKDDYGEPA